MPLCVRILDELIEVRPGSITELPESVTLVPLIVPGADHALVLASDIEVSVGTVIRVADGLIWVPFEHSGKTAYGKVMLRHRRDQNAQWVQYFFDIVPSRLARNRWSALFNGLRQVADPLITSHYSSQGVNAGARHDPTSRSSSAVAFAQLENEWPAFIAAATRIARSPRKEFQPGRPSSRHFTEGEPTADNYENALVLVTLEALMRQVRAWRVHADVRLRQDEAELQYFEVGKGGHNAALERIERGRQTCSLLGDREATLMALTRRLPSGSFAKAIRGLVPHVTARIQRHPDYRKVLALFRRFGHERMLEVESEWFSSLPTRRASTLYEYWCLFALCRAFERLGFCPTYQSLGDLVRDDVFDSQPHHEHPIEMRNADTAERLLLWYEPVARVINKEIKKSAAWRAALRDAPDGGLFAKGITLTPDFWLELHRDDGASVAAVGDAIFATGLVEQRADESVSPKKAQTVQNYAGLLARARPGRAPMQPHASGFVIFCGATSTVELLDEVKGNETTFLPLLPGLQNQDLGADGFWIDEEALAVLSDYLSELREHLTL